MYATSDVPNRNFIKLNECSLVRVMVRVRVSLGSGVAAIAVQGHVTAVDSSLVKYS